MTGPRIEQSNIAKYGDVTPIGRATGALGDRCIIKHGAYFVDGKYMNTFQMIEAANQVLAAYGETPIKLRRNGAGA